MDSGAGLMEGPEKVFQEAQRGEYDRKPFIRTSQRRLQAIHKHPQRPRQRQERGNSMGEGVSMGGNRFNCLQVAKVGFCGF